MLLVERGKSSTKRNSGEPAVLSPPPIIPRTETPKERSTA